MHTLQVQQFSELSCHLILFFTQQSKDSITQPSFGLQILMEDLYINVNFASTFYEFLTVSHLKSMTYLYHGSEKYEN